jgi:hypothetical protein
MLASSAFEDPERISIEIPLAPQFIWFNIAHTLLRTQAVVLFLTILKKKRRKKKHWPMVNV